jgi:hypothetical protein
VFAYEPALVDKRGSVGSTDHGHRAADGVPVPMTPPNGIPVVVGTVLVVGRQVPGANGGARPGACDGCPSGRVPPPSIHDPLSAPGSDGSPPRWATQVRTSIATPTRSGDERNSLPSRQAQVMNHATSPALRVEPD